MIQDNPAAGPRRRILLIDDSALERMLVKSRLRVEDIELFEAACGAEGLAAARCIQPDLILLDIQMAGWDGFDTIRRLKDDPLTRQIPVIFLSANSHTADKAHGLDLGAVDFVTKPFDPIELRARVRVALRSKYLLDLLEERAHLDGLTGLGNRHALEQRLPAAWSACRRRRQPVAVMIIDLDHFKRVNDEYGHAAGDEVLRRLAQSLRMVVRAEDFVARFGGEEFVVLAPDCDASGAAALAERFRSDVAETRIAFGKESFRVSASIGVSVTSDPGSVDWDQAMSRADQALYAAKEAGRDAVWLWTPCGVRPHIPRYLASPA